MNLGNRSKIIHDELHDNPGFTTFELAYYTADDWYWLESQHASSNQQDHMNRRKLITDAVLEGLTSHAKKTIWQAGDIQYFINRFEHAFVVNRSINPTNGIIVKLDTTSEHALLEVLRLLDTHAVTPSPKNP